MLLSLYTLLVTAALVATFVTVLTIDTRGLWSDLWLFTGPMGLLLSLLLAAASVNIVVVSGGVTTQFSNEYLVLLWTGLGGFNVIYLVYGPIAELRTALEAGPSQSPVDAGRDTDAMSGGQQTRGRILDSWRSSRERGELDLDFTRERSAREKGDR